MTDGGSNFCVYEPMCYLLRDKGNDHAVCTNCPFYIFKAASLEYRVAHEQKMRKETNNETD